MCVCLHVSFQDLHVKGWAVVKKFAAEQFPVVSAKNTTDLSHNIPDLNDQLERICKDIGEGTRRRELEYIIFWASLPTCGVITSTMQSWLQAFLQGYLKQGNFKTRSCAIILAPNRSCDITNAKKEEDDMDDGSDEETEGGFGGLVSTEASEETEASVRKVFALVTQALESKDLSVKEFRFAFKDDTTYGKRKAYHDGLLVSHNGENVFHEGKLWRRRFVEGVEMLPRNKCRKPKPFAKDIDTKKVTTMRSLETLTPVQTKKQDMGRRVGVAWLYCRVVNCRSCSCIHRTGVVVSCVWVLYACAVRVCAVWHAYACTRCVHACVWNAYACIHVWHAYACMRAFVHVCGRAGRL
jgi:hypothetical protein